MSVKSKLLMTAVGAMLAAGVAVTPALAEGEKIGDTQMCINSQDINDTSIIDHRTILVSMRGPRGYKRIDLANDCTGLSPGTGFAYSTSLSKLCKQDMLKVLETAGQTCIIDKIVTIDEAEAKAIRSNKNKQ